jgi:hypothetical protein
MSQKEKRAYLEAILRRYRKSGRKQKAKILDEFCEVCGYNRKYAIRLLHKKRKGKPKEKRGRKPRYDANALLGPLKTIWFGTDQMCSKKLKAALPEWLPHYEQSYGLLSDLLRGQLLTVSAATVDRLLKPERLRCPRKGLSGTKPGKLLKNQIPIKTDHWDVTQPGFMEADTVAHCGNSLAGDFVWSLTLTDICTTWTENRASWNKGAEGVKVGIKDIEAKLPFEILGFDCDNGSEFLNHHLIRYFKQRDKPVQFTRSRPYHKNDNAHVEQKNWTHVRELLGYDRFDNPQIVNLLNDLYAKEWSLYRNHFYPTMKLKEKKKIGSKYYKKYDKPQTPYCRVLASECIAEGAKERLRAQHELLNPFALKQVIEQKLKKIFTLVSVTSNVRQRL